MLGLCRCLGFSLVVVSGGCSLVAVYWLLTVVSSLVEHTFQSPQASVVVAPEL